MSPENPYCTHLCPGGNADIGEGIDKTGIDDEALAFDDPGLIGDGGVLSYGFDDTACDDDRGVFHA